MSIFENINLQKIYDIYINFDDNKSDELSEIMSKYNSDKGYGLCNNFIIESKLPPNLVCHNYTFIYNGLFHKYKNENITIFELGVGVPLCMGSWAGSLLGWKEYFPNSQIYSADIDKEYLYNDDRIKSFFVDCEDENSIKSMFDTNLKNNKFDIIIDDGPHTYTSNILFYKKTIEKLKDGGIYIIEDVNLDFINILYNGIILFNEEKLQKKYDVKQLILPWPVKFTHPCEKILKMNNLIFIHKKIS